jgi:AcrR family transcriptional regulator
VSDTGSTRDKILAAACELFAAQTYGKASMKQIADRLGIAKPSLYHHFPSKSAILDALIGAPLDELAAVVDAAERDSGDARRAVLRGCIAVMVDHRDVMGLLLRDASVYGDGTVQAVGRVNATVDRAIGLLAGPDPDWRSRLRAAQAFAAATDPIAQFADAPVDELRDALLAGAEAVLDPAGR